ncbi:hypothetical protein ZOSMA_64G00650 [Zostera marina]|uniref:Ubiquitin-like domain-containing protein n=1 Tax=Zostera marina TaxID=29655 RepID=A0A0K9NT87_ZOSMR|nr:hypothetical protein ZOSMA_64G00650 [Zostera marina]
MADSDGVDNNSALPTGSLSPPNTIKIHIKFSGRTIPLTIPPDSTVRIVKSLLQPLTNVLIRGQKLIFKGKVLIDAMNLDQLKILDGAKIMLIASEGLHQGG